MGLGSFLDPGDLLGGLSGSTGRDAANKAAEITNAELMRQFELSQENLGPALEAAQGQLPAIGRNLTPKGFGNNLQRLQGSLDRFLQPTEQSRGGAASSQLMQAGLNPSAGAISEASQIDPTTLSNLLLGSEADLFGNQLALSGLGEGAGTVLSELGQRTGAGIAEANINAQLAGQQATAQGQSNAMGLIGLGASFFSDERLKDNIEELGEYKGVRIIKWTWKDFVPEYWKDVTVGFSAQDILSKFPQFVSEKNGFYSLDKDNLINHLEAL
jgi:hypothetical protein